MNVLWGVVVTVLSLLAWGGQVVSWLSPETAVRWKVMEAEDDVEPAFWADVRGEATWDGFTLWTMVVAGVLLSLDSGAWPYFGLVGGGIYLYFGGRGIMSRTAMRRQGLRIGTPENVRLGFVFSAIWAVMALITIIAAVIALAELS
ncbi:MAG: hypothetical protein HKN91_12610 [Acidimicrobiia bacterium]|nr:hypothetical protein [Acidimicrobiia bacterium]